MKKKKLLFILNPISGGKKKKALESLIASHLDPQQFEFEIVKTEYPGHAAQLTQKNKNDQNIIVAIGGDGTINEVAQELIDTECCLGIIPQGSGNGLARHLGISINPRKAIEQINDSKQILIDTADLNGHFFVSIAGIGFDSLIAHRFSQSKNRGFIGYGSLSFQEFFKYKEQNYQMIIDGEKIDRDAFLIAFANSNQFGYDTKISPLADIQDGLLDVCILRKPRLDQIPLGFYQLWSSKAYRSNLLEIIKAKEIMIIPNRDEFANIDGESIHVGKEVKIKINTQSLRVWVPKT